MMKILFIQLPLIDHARGYVQGNVEYGPGAIAGYIDRNCPQKYELQHLPFIITNFCSDLVILKYIENYSPDVLSFSSFLWNVERNLRLAEEAKKIFPGIKIIFGGPEIAVGSVVFEKHNSSVDIFFCGEGEWFFSRFPDGLDYDSCSSYINGNLFIEQPPSELIPASQIPEPLSWNRMNSMPDGSVFLELTRGCPYRCEYCYYSKNSKGVRELPFKLLTDVLEKRKELSEIYILSPSFNRTPDFRKRLEDLAELNHGVSLHTEMKASGIDREMAGLIKKAGFRSLEVGLQTLTRNALKTIGRAGDPLKELAGMKNLRDAGIDLKIGIIPGLPGDTVEGFYRTVDILMEEGFKNNVELYQLMVLPGTLIRDRAIRDNVIFQKKPPYFFLEGWGFESEDLAEISSYVEEETGFYQTLYSMPDFSEGDGLFCKGVFFNAGDESSWDSDKLIRNVESNIFSFHIEIDNQIPMMELSDLMRKLPESELYNFILYSENSLCESDIRSLLSDSEEDSFYSRMNIYHSWTSGHRCRFFHVTESLPVFFEVYNNYEFIEPILAVSKENLSVFQTLDPDEVSILVGRGRYKDLMKFLVDKFGDCPERVGFSLKEDQEDFFKRVGVDYIDYPFSFSMRRI